MPSEAQNVPPGWRESKLGDIATFTMGRTPARARPEYWSQDPHGGVPWVSIGDMSPHGVVSETAERITARALDEVFRGRLTKRHSLLMSFKLTIGRIATLGVDACHNEAIVAIEPNREANQAYLGYFLSQVNYSEYQDRAIKGHTLNLEKINRIEVVLPPLAQQERIAAVLRMVQRSIEIERKLLATVGDLKQAAMRELFTHGLRGEAQKDTEIGLLPNSWSVQPLAELREFLQYGTSAKCDYDEGNNPVLRIPNVTNRRIDWADLKRCTLAERDVAKWKLTSGDVLFIRTNGVRERVGVCAVYQGQPSEALFASYLIRARLRSEVLDPSFFQWYSSTAAGTAQLSGRASPAADGKFNINTTTLDTLLVPLPRLDEQVEIAAMLDGIDRKVLVHKRKLAVLQDLFKTLLHDLMTGRIRVADLDIDVTDVTAA